MKNMKNQNPNPNSELPKPLYRKLIQRSENGSLRTLKSANTRLIDFTSNDYLGYSKHNIISDFAQEKLKQYPNQLYGATGSRLLSGNYKMIEDFEAYLSHYYKAEASMIFNSGYDANLGLISSVGQRKDLILYDELCHASIRDGIGLSNAKAYKFQHNDLEDLESKLSKFQDQFEAVYVITEHVFSMDGDQAPVASILNLCLQYKAYFILDEAHAVGVLNPKGCCRLSSPIFARIVTFGKAFGSHGAVILGSKALKGYLINFAKSFIYTTAPSPESTARNWAAHLYLGQNSKDIERLKTNIDYFQNQIKIHKLANYFIESQSAIQSCVVGGNQSVKTISNQLQEDGFDVRPILSPTVPKGKERLRICLHSFNTKDEIHAVLYRLSLLLIH